MPKTPYIKLGLYVCWSWPPPWPHLCSASFIPPGTSAGGLPLCRPPWDLAPHIVLQAVKTAIFASAVFSRLGYQVTPSANDRRSDIIQTIRLETKERLCNFCIAIQKNSPVDAHVVPVPAIIPGYQDEIIMAAGTFVQGASIELSADGPCREPYNVYFQGGLTFEHGRIAIMSAAKMVGEK